MKNVQRISTLFLLGAMVFLLAACNPPAGSDSDTAGAFPSGLSVASPTAYQASAGGIASRAVGGYASEYEVEVAEIDALLSATSTSSCGFEPAEFLSSAVNAACYGPSIAYQNHPDGADAAGSPPTLPGGDVGMWLEADATSGNACAADQLDSRLTGISRRASASLKGLASMVCVALASGETLPAAGGSLDLLTQMNALGVTDTSFTTATLTHSTDSSGDDVYAYSLAFNYTPGSSDYDIGVAMSHTPNGSTSGLFKGRMTYHVNNDAGTDSNGYCAGAGISDNASLVYDRTASALNLEMRSGRYCGEEDGLNASNVMDPTPYDAATATGGWAENFNKLTASFDPDDLAGDYVYAWQAGKGDSHSRVFNAHVSNDSSTGIPTVEAFFGFGNAMDSFSGNIEGMICNWAGPGNSHTPIDAVQHQVASLNTTTGVFDASTSALAYAPANNCIQGGGSFTFDINGDGTLDGGDDVTGLASSHSLLTLNDIDVNGEWDEIEAVVSLPSTPTYP
ncbi:MAG: hypothetical protein HUJ29_05290 [Gammaproteobacteria bacterium]|nr:hypothetical protein [Gammaproteobacteria bacterium]